MLLHWPRNLELRLIRTIMILMPWMLMPDVSPLFLTKKSRNYETLVDVLDARRRDTLRNIAQPNRMEMLSMGD